MSNSFEIPGHKPDVGQDCSAEGNDADDNGDRAGQMCLYLADPGQIRAEWRAHCPSLRVSARLVHAQAALCCRLEYAERQQSFGDQACPLAGFAD
jgi:hypothetical protein